MVKSCYHFDMNKNFIKYSIFGFLGSVPLNLLLFGTFDILTKLGIPNKLGNNVGLVLLVYAIEVPLYMLFVYLYLRAQSEKNLEKLNREVEKITGKKLS